MLPGGSRLAVPALAPVGAVPAAADLGEQEVGGVSREVGIPVGVSIKLVTIANHFSYFHYLFLPWISAAAKPLTFPREDAASSAR